MDWYAGADVEWELASGEKQEVYLSSRDLQSKRSVEYNIARISLRTCVDSPVGAVPWTPSCLSRFC